jgi:hypothetical protein
VHGGPRAVAGWWGSEGFRDRLHPILGIDALRACTHKAAGPLERKLRKPCPPLGVESRCGAVAVG